MQLADGGAVLGYVFNDATLGPCVRFTILRPSVLIHCFRTGLNLVSNPNPTDSDLVVEYTGTSLLAQVRCRILLFRPSTSVRFLTLH